MSSAYDSCNKTFFIGDDENLEYDFLLNNETETKFLVTP